MTPYNFFTTPYKFSKIVTTYNCNFDLPYNLSKMMTPTTIILPPPPYKIILTPYTFSKMLTPPTNLILTPLQNFENLDPPTFFLEMLTPLILTHYEF